MQKQEKIICKYIIINNCETEIHKEIINNHLIFCIEEMNNQLSSKNIQTLFNIDNIQNNKFYSFSTNLLEAKKSNLILSDIILNLSTLIREEIGEHFLFSGELYHFHAEEDNFDFYEIENNDLIEFEKERYSLTSSGFINQITNEYLNDDNSIEEQQEQQEQQEHIDNDTNLTRIQRFQRISKRTNEHNSATKE